MTITRVGTTAKYATGWDAAFGKGKSAKKSAAAAPSKKKAPAKKAKKGKK